ncbi:MAG TPA: acyl-CoA dehydrogenase family protein [Kofleriaceae bacterium]|nr:acyl-CoA dehydrogenase family protein [Kofleriaceae bacterium]
MPLVLTEDQTLLARTASEFVTSSAPVARLRKLRDSRDERGYSLDRYAKMAELGWTAIPFSDQDGGLGMGLAELVLVTEAMGRGLAPEPLIPSIALAGRAIALGGSAQHKSQWLTPAIAGEKVLALAHAAPRGRFDLAHVPFRATQAAGGLRLSGQATQVWGGHLADAYVVVARTAGQDGDRDGISLFVVPAGARGLVSERQQRVDSLNAAQLTLEDVEVREADALGKLGDGYGLLSRVIDEATVALTGEMLGGMSEALERTLAYLRERRQFGVAIGSFQGLKHRAARLYIELELSRSAVMAAARAVDAQGADAAQLVSLAKARLSDAYVAIANEAVQMHGGIGMTDEHEIGFFMKRARACEMTFGDAAYHRDRFAALAGY